MESKCNKLISFIREQFSTPEGPVPLHEPCFTGNERKYVLDAINSTFVSSVGAYVNRFEAMICEYTGSKHAIATVNGTSSLHISLKLAGVGAGEEVLTQSLSFIATANSIAYCNAQPVFLDVDLNTLGLSPSALKGFLEEFAEVKESVCFNKKTGRRIAAVLPMHTFGLPCSIIEINQICKEYNIPLIEDAAEALGSYVNDKHTGTYGLFGTFSFNGNKTITCGGGGAIITNDSALATKAKHITTTAKIPHKWEYLHDAVGYNYRMPNLNAAMACAQLEQLPLFIEKKRGLAKKYIQLCEDLELNFITEAEGTFSNYWLNAICLKNREERNKTLELLNNAGINSRPVWTLAHKMPMYAHCQKDNQSNADWLEDRIINIPSSVIM